MNLIRKGNLISKICMLGITFGFVAFLMACGGQNDEGKSTQENVDTLKSAKQGIVDTIAKKDTTKKVDQTVK